MTSPPESTAAWFGWTPRRRRALLTLLAVGAAWVAVRLLLNPTHLADPLPPAGPDAARLATGIDPNTADADTLAALPSIGPATAAAIVAYRESAAAERPGTPAFDRPEDLSNVPGIGEATVNMLRPHLVFVHRDPTRRAIDLRP